MKFVNFINESIPNNARVILFYKKKENKYLYYLTADWINKFSLPVGPIMTLDEVLTTLYDNKIDRSEVALYFTQSFTAFDLSSILSKYSADYSNFNDFLEEIKPNATGSESESEIFDILKKDCGPFLKEISEYGRVFYRGIKSFVKDDITRIYSRTDRKPMDTPLLFHEMIDNAFYNKFGWKSRSEGVFTNQYKSYAVCYGITYLFFPIGDYEYVWSRKIEDLFEDCFRFMKNNFHSNQIQTNTNTLTVLKWTERLRSLGLKTKKPQPGETVKDIINNGIDAIVSSYIDKNVIESGKHEVAFKCKEYYLVDTKYIVNIGKLFK